MSRWWVPTPTFGIKQTSGKLRRIDDAERSMSNHNARAKRGCTCALHSNLQYMQTGTRFGQNVGHFKAEVEQRAESFEHGGEDLTDAYRSSCLQKRIRAMLQYRYGKAPVDGMLQHHYDKHIHMVPSVSPVIILKTCASVVWSTSTAMAYHVGRAGMYPLNRAILRSPSLHIKSRMCRT